MLGEYPLFASSPALGMIGRSSEWGKLADTPRLFSAGAFLRALKR